EQGPPKRAKVKGKRSSNGSDNRRPFTEAEATAFLASLDGVDRDVSTLVSVSGMRIEEACSLLCSDVTEAQDVTWLQITDAKTEAGQSRGPVGDPKVRAMLHKRVAEHHGKKTHRSRGSLGSQATQQDAPLFPELPQDRFGDRSKPLVKRLGRALRSL